ncbi:N-methyl-L-tryptophan oxidase [Microterricola viridarii]|uniref:Sarcosine oxidase n=1 Tax=Microterricola viridarii TaxID=412690 RepID=A0A1H1T130_9MICO|nr:N-methyl-L-tryptophan oxidase [Microterricola viridarii]SDS53922.1 sarcosine oxidase [Microterricola viridarii]
MDAKIGVIGLGAAGSAALWRLAERGADVLGFEQYEAGHDRGSSHGYSRAFKEVTPQGPQESALSQRATGLWRQLEAESGESVLEMTGGLSIGRPDGSLITGLQRVSADTGLALEYLDAADLRRRFPQHLLAEGDIGVIDPMSGFLKPELAIRTEWQLAREKGARVIAGEVLEVIPTENSVRVVTAERTYEVETAIIAAGAWQNTLLPNLQLYLKPRRATLSWFRPKAGRDSAFAVGAFPVFTHEFGGQTGWGLPSFDKWGVKIGLDFTEGYEIGDPALNRPEVEAWELENVQAFVAATLPDLEPEPTYSRGCMITMTPDQEFSIGIPAEHPRLVVLSACSGRGFKMSAAVGDVGADLALTGSTTADISTFSPDRFIDTNNERDVFA